MDLLKEVKALDADPDRRLNLIERAKAKEDQAVKLLVLHALWRKMKSDKGLSPRVAALAFSKAVQQVKLEVVYG